MTNASQIKNMVNSLGANLCGIASVERFQEAPKGFHPSDIYAGCKSVIVFAKRVPAGSLAASNCVPYTHVNNMLVRDTDALGITLSLELEKRGITAVPIPSDDPYEHWEPERSYGRAILSMRHAGYLAGLGVLGKNTLLINESLGNMIQIGAVLVEVELEPDPIADYEVCPRHCRICLDACPQKALDGTTVNQELCRPVSNFKTEKGYFLKKCNLCRRLCPNCLGLRH